MWRMRTERFCTRNTASLFTFLFTLWLEAFGFLRNATHTEKITKQLELTRTLRVKKKKRIKRKRVEPQSEAAAGEVLRCLGSSCHRETIARSRDVRCADVRTTENESGWHKNAKENLGRGRGEGTRHERERSFPSCRRK